MTETLFFQRSITKLKISNPELASIYRAELYRSLEATDPKAATILFANQEFVAFIMAVLEASPFIRETLFNKPMILARLAYTAPEKLLSIKFLKIEALGLEAELSEAILMSKMRQAKLAAHIWIALCDLAGIFNTEETTSQLSCLAQSCIKSTVCFLLLDTEKKGKIFLTNRLQPEIDCGWIIFAMGKLGAEELNYSSDIDLIAFIDSDNPNILDKAGCVELYSRLTRRLIRIMQERTPEGYVFRTDLRLRPDPGATPLAIPLSAAFRYYESRGQNWERAAMIKARPIAGDIAAGNAFLAELSPFIWRKYLDYAAIADIHSIKRQIHTHKGFGDVAIKGHNIKLGRGGIREIEFFVQTQQLIAGGRVPELRGRKTVDMLTVLADKGWITPQICGELIEQYLFLRDVENRLQMLNDEQTHNLPIDDIAFEHIANLTSYETVEGFSERLMLALKTVEKHYAALFETAPDLGMAGGNLVFTGEDDDPETLETLSQIGFKRPSDICRIIRIWHSGRYRATQTAEARERLTELTPALLKAFTATDHPDEALMSFDAFLQGLPAGIQLFSLLYSNPALLELLVLIMGAAPRLAEIITRRPHIFDGLLDPALLNEIPNKSDLKRNLDAFLTSNTLSYEECLDRLRIFVSEQRFLIGIGLITGVIDGQRAGIAFSILAELLLEQTLKLVLEEFRLKYGDVKGGQIALLGMGKLGSYELTAHSDLDIILIYNHDDDAELSDGDKPLYVSQYYTRLTQRLIAALSAPTAEGIVYPVDMRLRPSGNKGPVATHIASFEKYHLHDAWTWEHMALTRANIVCGDADLTSQLKTVIHAIMSAPREPVRIADDIAEMRLLIEKEKPATSIWDIKLMAGGLLDLEFIAQFSVLMGGYKEMPEPRTTGRILDTISDTIISENSRYQLVEAYKFYTNLSQMIRLCYGDNVLPEILSGGLCDLLCRAVELPDLEILQSELMRQSIMVREIFNSIFYKDQAASD